MTDYDSIEVIAEQMKQDPRFVERIKPYAVSKGYIEITKGFKRVTDGISELCFPNGFGDTSVPINTAYAKVSHEEGEELDDLVCTFREEEAISIIGSFVAGIGTFIGELLLTGNYVRNYNIEHHGEGNLISLPLSTAYIVAVSAVALAVGYSIRHYSGKHNDNHFRTNLDKWSSKIKGVFKHSETPYDPEILKAAFKGGIK